MRDDIGGTGGGEKMQPIIATNASAEEIAALVLAVQRRRAEDVAEEVGAEFSKRLHQKIRDQLEAPRSSQESQ